MKINMYGIMIIVSLIANVLVTIPMTRKLKIDKTLIFALHVYNIIGIILGAYGMSYLTTGRGGFSSIGGVIGGILMVCLFGLQTKVNIKKLISIFLIPVPLMYGLGKFGCFCAGCCYGIHYDGIGHIIYHSSKVAPHNISLFPVQLLECIVFILIFVYICFIKKKFNQEKLIGMIFIICGVFKFLLDYLRQSHVGVVLSTNQVLCLVFIILGFVFIYNSKIKKDGYK